MALDLEKIDIPIGDWVEDGVDWIDANFFVLLDAIADSIRFLADGILTLLTDDLAWVILAILLPVLWLRLRPLLSKHLGDRGVLVLFAVAAVLLILAKQFFAVPPNWMLLTILVAVAAWGQLGWMTAVAVGVGLVVLRPLGMWPEDHYLLGGLIVLIGAWRCGWRFAVFAVVAVVLIIGMGLWDRTVQTLALVLAASTVALLLGVPLGIAMARSDFVESVVRPVLDLMQTMPPFVYLIPAAIFFGLGTVPGAIATLVFAMPPAVRLTNLGIRQVAAEKVEAGLAFGCTPRQLLFKVQLPLAMPSIMAGINQTIMLSLSMVVIASMIGAGGLGGTVLTGIQRLNIGLGFEGGLAVVFLAILLDRITQSFTASRKKAAGGGVKSLLKWFMTGRGRQPAKA